MLTDPISDMLTRIRNALMAGKTEVDFPFSKIKLAISEILKKEGFVSDVVFGEKERKIKIILKYKENKPAINLIRRVSKPGRRVYSGIKEFKGGRRGIIIFSTPQGILSHKDAKKKNVGGEVVCEIY